MKKIIIILIVLLISFITIFVIKQNNTEDKFKLNKKYYLTSDFIDLKVDTFNKLIKNKDSFAVFIYQPLCSTSYKFNKNLTAFAKEYQISFYKMSFNDMKKTQLSETVDYYPSLVIYKKGKIVDYLDANSEEDSEYYKSREALKKWFTNYVIVNEEKNKVDKTVEEDVKKDLKIDTKLENISYDENKVNIYMFWGNGCPHCEEQLEFLESIETEYGDYFNLNLFEVWENEKNRQLLQEFASAMGDEVSGVPYTIIGNRSFEGFNEKNQEEFLQIIKEQHKNSFDVYFKH